MLFSIVPKERLEDLYDMREELESLIGYLRDPSVRMIVVLGLRRTGKTSLVRVALNVSMTPFIYIDGRRVLGSVEAFVSELEGELTRALRRHQRFLKEVFHRVRRLRVAGLEVEIDRRAVASSLLNVLEELDQAGRQIVLVLDEAQELSPIRWMQNLLAYCYDNLRNVKLLVTGSEVRVLEDFLRVEDPEAPLFGRPFITITTRRLEDWEAVDFLTKGFDEVGFRVSEAELHEAAHRLDGIIGWLTYYGWYTWKTGSHREGLETAEGQAAKLLKSELERFLSRREEARVRYIEILRALSSGPLKWSEISRYLTAKLGRRIPANQLAKYLRHLARYGLIEKTREGYKLSDQLIRKALSQMTR